MDDPKFNEPRLALNRIYTRTGDKGRERDSRGWSEFSRTYPIHSGSGSALMNSASCPAEGLCAVRT